MRLTPRTVFLGLVALGLPFAVSVGWALGSPDEAPPAVSAPGGAGALGSAPVASAVPESVGDWVPRAPKPVSVVKPVRPSASASAAPSSGTPSAPMSGSAAPSLTEPPVPTPASVFPTPPDPDATTAPTSATPVPSGLRLVRRS
ncbi:hypothetical protein ACPCHT_26225 [Nucisporomicrobium flavum]|uniref:hypothetical protein n=1 Tax=Nucisporomicrobium flavum TaxID=2785915 RepID=UPI001F2DBF64|nr:hypothetical protein [Nucisporomicrobium flavum]